ncbi:hypothetical protein [Flavobacterium sp. 3HN19-14]|uniref:hypothetical protein n=1 Tax=Flavobacterium sp. 3HN19-14 TaxID=3448133 RepID=UPI003EDFDD04
MVQAQINAWLLDDARDYLSGVSLYAEVKFNHNIMAFFRRKQTPAHMKKLIYELGKFSDVQTPLPDVNSGEKVNATINEVVEQLSEQESLKDKLLFVDLPPELRPVLAEKNRLFSENCLLKVTLNELPDDAVDQAYDIQVKIEANWKRNAACWKQLDYWKEHRAVPTIEITDFEKMSPEAKLRRQQQLFASISKLKKRIIGYESGLKSETTVRNITKLKKALAKSELNLIRQESDLNVLTEIIERKHE